jgi:two-component system, cell cycle sensor histidine kinase and response regulator CckA
VNSLEPLLNTQILIVEDEGLIALALKKKLEQAGYLVPTIVANGADALLSNDRFQPSLVLMDIRLQGPQDGVETAEHIRRRFRIPVMFVTALGDRETLDRAKITQPFGYIVKPFHGVNFRAQIEMALWKHKMEQELRASEAWLSITIQNVADALIATDSEGNIAFMNESAAELTGWDCDESKGQPLLDVFQVFEEVTELPVVHPLYSFYDDPELGTKTSTFKLVKRGCSDWVVVEAEISANRDEHSLLGIIVVFRDVTERRKLEGQNRQLQKMNSLSLMACGVGRELTESLRRVDDLLKRLIAQSDSSSFRLLGEVYLVSAAQQSIVQQLMALGTMRAEEPARVDLHAVLTELEPEFRKTLGKCRSLSLTLQVGILPIEVDPIGLRENLLRLILDARYAMVDGGAVEISTMTIKSDVGPIAHLTIRDTGKCILASAKERVFDPYYKSRLGNKNPGFSLALVYQFVVLNGGSIEVEGAPGKTVAYHVNFPTADYLRLLPEIDDKSLVASA